MCHSQCPPAGFTMRRQAEGVVNRPSQRSVAPGGFLAFEMPCTTSTSLHGGTEIQVVGGGVGLNWGGTHRRSGHAISAPDPLKHVIVSLLPAVNHCRSGIDDD